jgi:general secretion pathway protein L
MNSKLAAIQMVREFIGWWLGQLADLLPDAWRRFGAQDGDGAIITPDGPLSTNVDGVIVAMRRKGEETPLGSFHLGGHDLRAIIPHSPADLTVLRLSEADVLAKTLVLPLAAERQLDQVIAFEMDRETPFEPEEVFWNRYVTRRDRRGGQIWVRLLLVPRVSLVGLLQALDQVGIRPRRVEIGGGPDRDRCLPIDDGGRSLHQTAHRSLLWSALACCVVLTLAAIVVPFVRQSLALAAVERQLAADSGAASEAEKLRREIDRLSGGANLIEAERTKGGQPLAVLAALTHLLPSDTYLTDFTQQNGKVTLSGRSAGASRLIALLAAADRLRNAAFAAPVTRIAANQPELFTIAAEVVP